MMAISKVKSIKILWAMGDERCEILLPTGKRILVPLRASCYEDTDISYIPGSRLITFYFLKSPLSDVRSQWGSWKVRFSAWLAGVQNWQGRLTHIMTGIIIQAGILDMHGGSWKVRLLA